MQPVDGAVASHLVSWICNVCFSPTLPSGVTKPRRKFVLVAYKLVGTGERFGFVTWVSRQLRE